MEEIITPEEEGIPDSGPRSPEERFRHRVTMRVPDRHNPRLRKALDWVNANDDLYGLWVASNVTAIERLGMTDHGPVHVKIVMNLAVRLLRLLTEAGVEPAVTTHYDLPVEDAEVVVALAALLHDVGMSIHRKDHEAYSLFLAQGILEELLPELWEDPPTRAVLRSEILHAIIGHRSGGQPLTLEAGVVRIADALDMAKGRSRIPFEAGSVSIHSVSAAAVERVHLEPGQQKPVRLQIDINNSAGIFQLDQLFREKLKGSGLEPYIELEARLTGPGGQSVVEGVDGEGGEADDAVRFGEKRLFRGFSL